MANFSGGFGTRIYFIPDTADAQSSQILKGSGYVTINLKGAHYRSEGNLWQKLFGGSDNVVLSTQVTRTSGTSSLSIVSIEDTRQIRTNQPYYFDSGRQIALNIPADADSIGIAVTISAVMNDNLSAALGILNSGELKGTLELAPPAVSSALAIATVVKKLLSNTNPQNSLQGEYAGRLSTAASGDPIRDFCLAQGTIVMLYRESADDTSLDNLDPAKLSTDGDGLKYAGAAVENTYTMFQVSFEELRGEDASAEWYGIFSTADQALNELTPASSDADQQRIWASAYATYQQAAKLLASDPSYTVDEAQGIAAARLKSLEGRFGSLLGQTVKAESAPDGYLSRLVRAKVALAGPLRA